MERAERRFPHFRIGDLGVRREEGKGLAPELVAQRSRESAREEQGARLVAQSDQLGRRNPRGEIAANALVPDEALQLEHGHHPQAPIEVQEGALEVARVLSQATEDGRVPLAGVVGGAQLPLAPVLAPERLHLGVVALVELARRGDERFQCRFEIAAEKMPHDESLPVLQVPEALRVEVIDHADALDLAHAFRHALRVFAREVAHGHLESVGGDVRARERLARPPHQLEPEVPGPPSAPPWTPTSCSVRPCLSLSPQIERSRRRTPKSFPMRSSAASVETFCLSIR